MKHSVIAACLGALLLAQGVANAGITYAEDLRGTDLLISFPADDPLTQTAIDPDIQATGWYTYAMDFNTAGTVLYVANNINNGGSPPTGPWDLGTVDPVTGAYTPGPQITLIAANPSGLSMDPTTETLYMSLTDALYTIDPTTGVTTLVNYYTGTTPASLPIGLVIDIAIDASGQMYAHDISNDCLWSVDKTTAVATYIATSNMPANFAQGMDFDPDTDTLYAAIYTGSGTGVYGTWDTTTGVITTIELLPNIPDYSVELELAIRPDTGFSPVFYCTGKTTSEGCVPYMDFTGTASATSTGPFKCVGRDVLGSTIGILLYSSKKGAMPDHHGGKLCIKSPFKRTPGKAAKTPSNGVCPTATGRYVFDFQLRIQGGSDPSLTAGANVFVQFRGRDVADPAGFGDSLTNGMKFIIEP